MKTRAQQPTARASPNGISSLSEPLRARERGSLRIIADGQPTHARKDTKGKLVACNELGDRIGEGHRNARLTDAQVEEIRDRFEAHPVGHAAHEGYRVLSRAFGVSKRTIRDIVDYRRRNVWPAKWKRVDK
jgi:hypothetical protein